MIGKILTSSQYGWLKLLPLFLFFLGGGAFLLHYYGEGISLALMDSGLFTVLLFVGFLLLENVFKYYKPQQENLWLALLLPLMIASLVVVTGRFLLPFLMDDTLFIKASMMIRGALILLIFMGYVLVLIVNGKLEDQLEIRNREELIGKMAKEAELFHLRQQLQPHFLFNSLNSISALVKRQPEKAREMILQLSTFLRGTIRENENEWVSVADEAASLQLFLAIERVRFGHRLEVDFEVEENCLSYKLPPLLLQPLLENAVKHGLYGLIEKVVVKLSMRKVGNYLEVEILNPFDPESISEKGTGFGLESVKRRLYLFFGRNDLLTFVRSNNIFHVKLRIPLLS
ncbi:histidine kinase [Echinicola marina]|uniref:sensor histidine kinase n=1 Tax=Echinicola marina TaxID=2859768 RepID=UPI001CF63E25|nr:histidine kinase [Echinicola marina]UCS93496.1 histidine kinase [Echinicola marina]